VPPAKIAVILLPNLFNVCTLATDLLMLRFLKKTILPANSAPLQSLNNGENRK
jgi:hypothetical protein